MSFLYNKDNEERIKLKSEENENSNEEHEDIENIKQMGVPNIPQSNIKDIQCITIIGEIEGHFAGNPQKNVSELYL